MLSSGEFLDLNTVGFDVPEGYAIPKNGRLDFAFFFSNPRPWGLEKPLDLPDVKDRTLEGRLDLRGLEKSRSYALEDDEHGESLGPIDGSSPHIETKFTNQLLLEAIPFQRGLQTGGIRWTNYGR